jgi:hypothetical protein
MKASLYSFWEVVYYCGALWRVLGPAPEGRLHLRRCGWEYSTGLWGWDGYGRPVDVSAMVSPSSGLLGRV